MEDTRNLPAGEAMAATIRGLQQRGYDEVVAAAKERKAELIGKIGDLTLELEQSKADHLRGEERATELRTRIAKLEGNVAELEQELETYPLRFEESVMSRLLAPIDKMTAAAIAEIRK